MDASRSSCSWLLVILAGLSAAAYIASTADVTAVRPPTIDLVLDPPPNSTPALLPPCEHWPDDLSLRSAMQTCSMYAHLETNERWLFEVRAQIIDHRMADMVLTEIDRHCDYCFDREAEGREERARLTIAAVTACMREQLSSAKFSEDTCTLDTRWAIQSDW
jgi:hypothetical protein